MPLIWIPTFWENLLTWIFWEFGASVEDAVRRNGWDRVRPPPHSSAAACSALTVWIFDWSGYKQYWPIRRQVAGIAKYGSSRGLWWWLGERSPTHQILAVMGTQENISWSYLEDWSIKYLKLFTGWAGSHPNAIHNTCKSFSFFPNG